MATSDHGRRSERPDDDGRRRDHHWTGHGLGFRRRQKGRWARRRNSEQALTHKAAGWSSRVAVVGAVGIVSVCHRHLHRHCGCDHECLVSGHRLRAHGHGVGRRAKGKKDQQKQHAKLRCKTGSHVGQTSFEASGSFSRSPFGRGSRSSNRHGHPMIGPIPNMDLPIMGRSRAASSGVGFPCALAASATFSGSCADG